MIQTRTKGTEVLGVNFEQRTIDVIAVPWNEVAIVVEHGEMYREVFHPGAFRGVDTNPEKVRVNREHNRSDAVGKVISFDTNDSRGLIATIKIANTARGDDTLGLANEGMLSASLGYGVEPHGLALDRRTRTRHITSAWLEHIALCQSPAYAGAKVLAVRATPNLDVLQRDPVFVWAHWRTDPVMVWARRRGGK